MIKNSVKLFLLAVLVFLLSKGFIAFVAYQSISKLKEQYSDDFLLTYQWVSSSLDGVVSIKGLEITPYAMKKTFTIDEIRLAYPSYFSLMSKLPDLSHGDVSDLQEISVPNIQTTLTGKSVKELLSEQVSPVWFVPFNLYGCGEHKALSHEEYELMGIKQQQMSLNISLEQHDPLMETILIHLNQQELGEFNVSAKLAKHSLQQAINGKALNELKVHFLSLMYQDAGFFRRLNILCNKHDSGNRAIFSTIAASEWKDAMFSKGLLVNEILINAYSDYLRQGGTISFEANTQSGIQLNDLDSLLDKELFSNFDATLKLNGRTLKEPKLYPDSMTLFPPKAEEKPEPQLDVQAKRPSGYQQIDLVNIAENIGKKIRVIMQNGKSYEGLLTETTEYNLELTQNLPGGVVHYPLMLNEIETLEVWFNQER